MIPVFQQTIIYLGAVKFISGTTLNQQLLLSLALFSPSHMFTFSHWIGHEAIAKLRYSLFTVTFENAKFKCQFLAVNKAVNDEDILKKSENVALYDLI